MVKLGFQKSESHGLLPNPEPLEVPDTFISVDDHLVEPRHMFEGRLERKLQPYGGFPAEEIRMLTHLNAAALYRHPLPDVCLP